MIGDYNEFNYTYDKNGIVFLCLNGICQCPDCDYTTRDDEEMIEHINHQHRADSKEPERSRPANQNKQAKIDKIITDEFREFLKQKNCLKEYYANFDFENYDRYLINQQKYFIESAFLWNKTLDGQGHDFWSKIHASWLSHLSAKQNEKKLKIDKIITPEFRQFLSDNNCLDQYYTNFDLNEDFSDIPDADLIAGFVINHFFGGDTPEGWDFWYKIAYKWFKHHTGKQEV